MRSLKRSVGACLIWRGFCRKPPESYLDLAPMSV
jgi:hypothetical protein